MKNLLTLDTYCAITTTLAWRPPPNDNNNKNYNYNNNNNYNNKNYNKNKKKNLPKTLITRNPKLKTNHSLPPLQPPCSPLPHLQLEPNYDHSHALPQPYGRKYSQHTQLLVDKFHENQRLRSLLEKLENKGSNPLQILKDDGDWSSDHFWFVIRFLKHDSRSKQIPQVFDVWKNVENSRINESNYKKIIVLLGEEGLMDEALSALQELKSFGLAPSLEIYNSIIHGFARKAKFDDALFFLKEMEELNLSPNAKTYNGILQAYGHYEMYDEIGKCVKKMESDGFVLDSTTYNLLIREFSRGGLLKRMERVYQSLLSRRMELQPSTSVAMLEAYANFRLVEKMEKVYRRVLNSSAPLNDDLIRKLACVYIENFMFSRLDDLAIGLSSKTVTTNLVWCLRLLSHACLLSREGMDSVIGRMEEAEVTWNANFANIILLAYMKMEDFKQLQKLLLELPIRQVKPDIVTVGILFDAIKIGFDGNGPLNTWRRMGFLAKPVEMNTDPLVLSAFGKGHFLQSFEDKYSSLEPKAREKETWTYQRIIDLVLEHKGKQPRPVEAELT